MRMSPNVDERELPVNMRVIRMFKLGRQPCLGASRRQYLDCGVMIGNLRCQDDQIDPVEGMGVDEYRE